jgi:hypothetical protein
MTDYSNHSGPCPITMPHGFIIMFHCTTKISLCLMTTVSCPIIISYSPIKILHYPITIPNDSRNVPPYAITMGHFLIILFFTRFLCPITIFQCSIKMAMCSTVPLHSPHPIISFVSFLVTVVLCPSLNNTPLSQHNTPLSLRDCLFYHHVPLLHPYAPLFYHNGYFPTIPHSVVTLFYFNVPLFYFNVPP